MICFALSLFLRNFVPGLAAPRLVRGGRPPRGVAQLASASGLGPEGRVFESHHPDRKKPGTARLFPFLPFSYLCSMDIQQIMDIVREAGTLMDRTGGFEVHDKGARENIVTSSDVAVQHFLTRRLGELLPGSGFLCEEEDFADTAHEAVWIIDPIDGTANYARGNENCCISVALVRGGELAMGVVFCPWRGELYSAEKGCGAFCNGKPIHVSNRTYERGLLFTAMSTYRKDLARSCSDIIYDVYMACNDVRRTGSAAVELCLMSAGFAELYFEMRLMPWDYAAASLILLEAGGAACDFTGGFPSLYKPSMFIAANTREHCERLLATVHKHLDQVPY